MSSFALVDIENDFQTMSMFDDGFYMEHSTENDGI